MYIHSNNKIFRTIQNTQNHLKQDSKIIQNLV